MEEVEEDFENQLAATQRPLFFLISFKKIIHLFHPARRIPFFHFFDQEERRAAFALFTAFPGELMCLH